MAKVGIVHNLPALGGLIGIMEGLSEGFESNAYLEGILRDAHGDSDDGAAVKFDRYAAGKASSGEISHMYEYGQVGKMDAGSRLWVHQIEGNGGHQSINFTYRAATVPNPDRTTASTGGVPQHLLDRYNQGKYVFKSRAFIMDSGKKVTIEPGDSGWLFIPTPDTDKKYVLTKKSVTVKHKKFVNNFNVDTWEAWWKAFGDKAVGDRARMLVEKDVERLVGKELAALNMSPGQPRVSATQINSALKRKRGKVKAGLFRVSLHRQNKVRR